MFVEFNRWPTHLENYYHQQGYWIDKPLCDILDRHKDSDRPALISNGKSYSYRQLNQYVDNFAGIIKQRNLQPGQTALVQLGNVAEFYIVFFALLKTGIVPLNALFKHQRIELRAYAQQITPSLLIADRNHSAFNNNDFINELQTLCPTLQHIILADHENEQNNLTTLINHSSNTCSSTPTPANEVAFFQLSGGSTGTPKLIPRTHNDYYYSIRASVDICHFSTETRFLCALPAAHNYPMSSPGALGTFYAGGLVVMSNDPSAATCFPIINDYQITVTALVPPAVSLWLESVSQTGNNRMLNSLTLLQVGGAHLSEAIARRIKPELGCQLQQVFGMAEGLVNYTRLDDNDEICCTTQGRPISPDDEVWVADHNGNKLPYGEAGRLMTRGPYTFRGYYRNSHYNQQVFDQQGFYCSGDIITQSAQGYIKVVGREKDQINRGGEKIAAEEIENILLVHPQIINAALVSIFDPLLGEKSCAYIVSRQSIKAVLLRRFLREQGIADYKIPDKFIMVNQLPLTAVGKVDKLALRTQTNLDQQMKGKTE